MLLKNAIRAALASLPPPLLSAMRLLIIRPLRTYIRFGPWPNVRLLLYNAVAEHLWWLETTVEARMVFGGTLQVDASDIVGKHIYYFGIWEPKLTRWIQRRLRPGDLFVDVGANVGYYSLLASKLVGDTGKVVAIEALPQTFSGLEQNLRKNKVGNVRTVNAAAWDKPDKVKIFTRQEGLAGSTTLMFEWADKWHLKKQLEIDAKPLSAILTREEIQAARLIKIDVEGAEWRVLSEMASWLERTRADLEIAVEISRSMMQAQGKTFQEILALFSRFGMRAYRIENDYLASTCIAATGHSRPRRIQQWPNEPVDQVDLIFSRSEADFL